MKIFIDIGHPAHVHYFRNFISIMKKEGHEIFVSARDRYPVKELLDFYDIPFYNRGKGKNSVVGKLAYMFYIDVVLFFKSLKFRPDIFISFTGAYTTHVGKLLNIPSLVIDDTDSEVLNRKFYQPFATNIFTPDVFQYDLGKKHVKFKGYMELAYLHPKYFKNKNNGHDILNIDPSEKYTIVRFVNWQANHDYGHNGISEANKIKAVKEFSKFGKVYITSEKELPNELDEYRISIPPEQMHDVMASASLLYGESATMASESAVLGVPAIYIDDDGRSYTDEEESRYGIVFNFKESESDVLKSIDKAVEILGGQHDYSSNHTKLLSEKISFTDYLEWMVKNFPQSIKELQDDFDYQNRFIIEPKMQELKD